MGYKIIFLHNKAIEYRLKPFSIIKEKYGNSIEFWFYHEIKKSFPGIYYKYVEIFGKRFSLSAVLFFMKAEFNILILSGSMDVENILFFIIAKIRRKPVIFWTEFWAWGQLNLKYRFFNKLLGGMARHSCLCLYPGKQVKAYYHSIGVPESRMIFTPNASVINGESMEVYETKKNKKKIVVGYMGRIMERKGLNYLISAFKLLPPEQFELHIKGLYEASSKHFYRKCMDMIKENPSIRFTEAELGDGIGIFLSSVDVFVYPSVNSNGCAEPWGLALNEAASLGIRLVATDAVGAAFDLIKNGINGFLVNQKNPEALKDGILKASRLDKKRAYDYSMEISKQYSHENMAQGFIRAIESVSSDEQL